MFVEDCNMQISSTQIKFLCTVFARTTGRNEVFTVGDEGSSQQRLDWAVKDADLTENDATSAAFTQHRK